MTEIIQRLKRYAKEKPNNIAYTVYDEVQMEGGLESSYTMDSLTWEELDNYSDRLAGYISIYTKSREPLIVYGHKSKYMIVCFMGCVKSGHTYVPVDISIPASRMEDIIDSLKPEMILATEDGDFSLSENCKYLGLNSIENISREEQYKIAEDLSVKLEDIFYIIFTSGSTGKPKGVQISTECLTNYINWGQNLAGGGYFAVYISLPKSSSIFLRFVSDGCISFSLYRRDDMCNYKGYTEKFKAAV